DDGSVKCWGYGGYGIIGNGATQNYGDAPGTMGDKLPAVYLRESISSGSASSHSCTIFDDGRMKCWGNNSSGQLGSGSTQPFGVPGYTSTAILYVDVGTGRTVASVAEGGSHTCAVLDNGSVKCWGDNSSGQLGVPGAVSRGGHPNEMGD